LQTKHSRAGRLRILCANFENCTIAHRRVA